MDSTNKPLLRKEGPDTPPPARPNTPPAVEEPEDGFVYIKPSDFEPHDYLNDKGMKPVQFVPKASEKSLRTKLSQSVENIFFSKNPTGQESDIQNVPKELKPLFRRLLNVKEPKFKGANRGRLTTGILQQLLEQRGVIEIDQGTPKSTTNSQMVYVEPVEGAGTGTSTEETRITGKNKQEAPYSLIGRLQKAISDNSNNNKTIATTYVIPGFENHIVTIYVKGDKLNYLDPKGNPAPKILGDALQQLAKDKKLIYQENNTRYQQDTMNCGSYAALVLEQLHQGNDPALKPGTVWIEGVKQQWAREIFAKSKQEDTPVLKPPSPPPGLSDEDLEFHSNQVFRGPSRM